MTPLLLILAILFVSVCSKDKETPPNIILFIGDGMGPNIIEYARMIEYGDSQLSSYQTFTYQRSVMTANSLGTVTDSAAGATSISTGTRTLNGMISQDPEGNDLSTLTEIAKAAGYTTGVCAKIHLTHATPAGFLTHGPDREDHQQLAEEMLVTGGADVMLGAGSGPDYLGNYTGDWADRGYTVITDWEDLPATGPVLGLFADEMLPYAIDYTDEMTTPDLLDLTRGAADLLQADGRPFFLMVEASLVDKGGHHNNASEACGDMIELEHTLRHALEWVEDGIYGDLNVFVVADHETGGFTVPDRYEDLLADPLALPATADTVTARNRLRQARIAATSTSFSTDYHTGSWVVLAGEGEDAQCVMSARHHSDVSHMLSAIMRGDDASPRVADLESFMWGFWLGLLSTLVLLLVLVLTAVLIHKSCLSRKSSASLPLLQQTRVSPTEIELE
eukprot:gnl/Dysnectes_brevis/1966_a2260_1517.p1 GENE.gnl/Dysnectes_brevis/1966_a2260_1517~~gnl/Dysnectes_brevis/1966_a2260_1517.p1  ORF type:complete len:448 (-),score=226.77 gnl/Dysnectes_brevis/1966_a2260_1517:89-1432(-)